jgi:hypothetical protein
MGLMCMQNLAQNNEVLVEDTTENKEVETKEEEDE